MSIFEWILRVYDRIFRKERDMPPKKDSATRQVECEIRNKNGIGIDNAAVTLLPDGGGSFTGNANVNGSVSIAVPRNLTGGTNLTATADDYIDLNDRGTLPLGDGPLTNDIDGTSVYTMEPVAPPIPPGVFPPEVGPLQISGSRFFTQDGHTWAYRGASMFTLHARMMRGESITTQINWMKSIGANVARTFGRFYNDQWQDYWFPEEDPDYWPSLAAYFKAMGDVGLRVEIVPITGKENGHEDFNKQKEIVQKTFDIAAAHWNVIVQVVNEPRAHGKPSPRDLMQGINTHGVVWASGDYPVDGGGDWDQQGVYLGMYLNAHLPRLTDHKFSRSSKDLYEMERTFGIPVVADEEYGFGEVEEPGRRLTTARLDDVLGHWSIAHLYVTGMGVHCQAGLEGRAPDPIAEPEQTTLCVEVSKVWQFIPPYCSDGTYVPANQHQNFPIIYRDGDSQVDHAYASLCGGESWTVVPTPKPGWAAENANGWTKVADGPKPYILKSTR